LWAIAIDLMRRITSQRCDSVEELTSKDHAAVYERRVWHGQARPLRSWICSTCQTTVSSASWRDKGMEKIPRRAALLAIQERPLSEIINEVARCSDRRLSNRLPDSRSRGTGVARSTRGRSKTVINTRSRRPREPSIPCTERQDGPVPRDGLMRF